MKKSRRQEKEELPGPFYLYVVLLWDGQRTAKEAGTRMGPLPREFTEEEKGMREDATTIQKFSCFG